MASTTVPDPGPGPALRIAARTASLGTLAIVLAFLFGEGRGWLRLTRPEAMLFAFFPVGVLLGLALAWRREILGGGLALASLAGFYVSHRLQSSRFPAGFTFLLLASPGLLFLLAGWLRFRTSGRRWPIPPPS